MESVIGRVHLDSRAQFRCACSKIAIRCCDNDVTDFRDRSDTLEGVERDGELRLDDPIFNFAGCRAFYENEQGYFLYAFPPRALSEQPVIYFTTDYIASPNPVCGGVRAASAGLWVVIKCWMGCNKIRKGLG